MQNVLQHEKERIKSPAQDSGYAILGPDTYTVHHQNNSMDDIRANRANLDKIDTGAKPWPIKRPTLPPIPEGAWENKWLV